MRPSINRLRLIGVMALASLVLLAACESDADRIRSVNEADRTQTASSAATPTLTPLSAATPTPTPLSAKIDTVDIQDGDCIDSTLGQGVSIESVVIVPCSGSWEYRVLSSFTVPDSQNYPGEDHLNLVATERCDRRSTFFLHPTSESWALGDRTNNCLQESFGLSTSDPAKLDRLASTLRLDVGECFTEAPETGGLLVEVVDCSGNWEYRVLSSIAVADSAQYPAEDHFISLASERCDRRFAQSLFPTSESWQQGDRTLSCLQMGFGLSSNDPAKLDRLVSVSRLDVGECYNEAPETGGLMVELVDCSGDWESQVVDVFSVSFMGAFPGDVYLQGQAYANCPEPWHYFYAPSDQTWGSGDRKVTCVRAR